MLSCSQLVDLATRLAGFYPRAGEYVMKIMRVTVSEFLSYSVTFILLYVVGNPCLYKSLVLTPKVPKLQGHIPTQTRPSSRPPSPS